MNEPRELATRSHVVSHLLREVESMMRQSLATPSNKSANRDSGEKIICPYCGESYEAGADCGHRQQIEHVVETYQWDSENASTSLWIDQWKEMARKGKNTSPATWAHRHNLDPPRPSDAEIPRIRRACRVSVR